MKTMIILLGLILSCDLSAEEIQDQKWQVGSFKLAEDKQTHYFAGFACYSVSDRLVKSYIGKYGVVVLFAGGKEVLDSWRTRGDFADFSYTMLGAVSCHMVLKFLNKENRKTKVKVGIDKNKLMFAVNF